MPDLAVGRVPALTAEELDGYVRKIEDYEASDGSGWRDRALWLADKPSTGAGSPTRRRSWWAVCSPGYAPERIYLQDGTIAASRAQLLAGLNSGASLMNYVGHGGIDRLSADGLLVSTDAPGLVNGGKLPFLTALTCTINRFEVPGYSSLGGELVKAAGGGASAVWAPTGLSIDFDASALGASFYSSLAARPGARIGELVEEALRAYAASGRDRSLVRVYNLLGDPGIVLKVPLADVSARSGRRNEQRGAAPVGEPPTARTRGPEDLTRDHVEDSVASEDDEKTQTGSVAKKPYEPPRILSREPLEAVAATCSPPGKSNPGTCPVGTALVVTRPCARSSLRASMSGWRE